ncbi:MAG TPA: rhomboid family intramembrane serine protease [Archaeoglobus profundus]|nr:rhomboid family intramembrane serine protease [Archaeoglobus profundus]
MTKCDICGKEEPLPFTCRYCGGTFCADHRLPEKHNCPNFNVKYWNVPVKVKKRSKVEDIRDKVRTITLKVKGITAYGINTIILIICTILYFLKIFFAQVIDYYLALHPLLFLYMPWQLITSMFIHASFEHFFVNMLVLFFFGFELERRIGSTNYFKVFFLSGLAGNLAYLLYAYFINPYIPAMGASAAIFGVMGCLAMVAPYINIIIFPIPIPINIRIAILLFALFDLLLLPFTLQTGVAHIAHLAGLAVGLYLGKIIKIKIRLMSPYLS